MKYEVEVRLNRTWFLEIEAENNGEAEKIALEQVQVMRIPPAYEEKDAVALRTTRES